MTAVLITMHWWRKAKTFIYSFYLPQIIATLFFLFLANTYEDITTHILSFKLLTATCLLRRLGVAHFLLQIWQVGSTEFFPEPSWSLWWRPRESCLKKINVQLQYVAVKKNKNNKLKKKKRAVMIQVQNTFSYLQMNR